MIRYRKYIGLQYLTLLLTCICLAGCKVGEDDPFISFRSRNTRLKANWKLSEMTNYYEIRTINPGQTPEVTVVHASFNGYDLQVRTAVNGILVSDTTFGFNHLLKIQEDGELSYENTVVQNIVGVKSVGKDNWYWLDTDKKKARVFVGAALKFPATAGIPQFSANSFLQFSSLFSDFAVEGLRNEELELTYDKVLEQVTLSGFQQITVSSKMSFNSK